MNGKAFKWLQETLNYPSYLHLLKPPKRQNNNNHDHHNHNDNYPNLLQHPLRLCKPGEHHVEGLSFDDGNSSTTTNNDNNNNNNNNNNIGVSGSNQPGRIYLPFQSSHAQLAKIHGINGYNNPLCSSIQNISSSLWANLSDVREKYVHGKLHAGRGRAWTPPGLELGKDASGTSDAASILKDNLDNASYPYPDYGFYNYNYNYDYDQPDWLTSHLDELYAIMRSSQMETNIALTVFLAIVFLFGVTGNILVLAVFSRGAGQQQASTVFIKALAVTDLIICLVVLPGVLLKEWFIPYRWDALCQGWELIRCSTIPLSTLILASVAVDRYVKICRMDKSIQITTSTAKKILLVTAIISVCLGIPPMLRMGVYQAGEGPASSKIYLGLCMGNDLLVSKETVDWYWQAMAAKFLLVLLVVMVMYGLVFRTVYRQSRRWGRCATRTNDHVVCNSGGGGGSGSGKRSVKGWFNKAYDENDDDGPNDNDGDGDECKRRHNNSNPNTGYNKGARTSCTNGVGNLGVDTDGDCREHRIEDVQNCHGTLRTHSGKYTGTRTHKKSTIESVQSEEKKSSLSLSFLCGSKRNADVVIEKAPKLLMKNQDALHDDGITSLDDGHMSYFNTPSTSSQQKTEMKNKKRPLSAIFSCTSQLTISRKAYVSKKSYYQSEADKGDEDEDIENGTMTTTPKKGKIPLPHWLRRWKRLITVALFTTTAEREEEKKSAVKLALRQNAKIKMLNQEASCDIQVDATSSLEHPHDNTVSQITDSPSENTFTTKLSSTNPASSVVVNTTETNLVKKRRTKLKKWSQSLDFVTSNTEQKDTIRKGGRVHEVNVKREEHGAYQECNDPETIMNLDGTPFPVFQSKKEGITKNMITPCQNENRRNSELANIPQIDNISIKTGDGPFQTWLKQQVDQRDGKASALRSFGVNEGFKPENLKVLHSISCPISSKMVDQSMSGNRKNIGGNKVHPLNSPLFSYSVPNIRVTTKQGGQKDHNSDSHGIVETNKQWSSKRVEHCDYEIPNTSQIHKGCTTHFVDFDQNLLHKNVEKVASSLANGNEHDKIFNHSDVEQTCYNVENICHKSGNIQGIAPNPNHPLTKTASTLRLPTRYSECENAPRGDHHCEKQNHHCIPYQHYQKQANKKQQQERANQKQKGKMGSKHGSGNGRIAAGGTGRKETVGVGGVRRAPHRRYNGAQVKTAQVLFLVTVIYVLSFAPVLLMCVEAVPSHPIPFYGYFIHSAANPILYSFINEAFRSQLYRLLCPHCCKKK